MSTEETVLVGELPAADERMMAPMAPCGAEGEAMVDQGLWESIQVLWRRGMSKKAIARELDLDPKTVRKWIRRPLKPQRRRLRGRQLDGYREFLEGRGPEVGWNSKVLTRELAQLGYAGCYATVADYVKPWRDSWRGANEPTLRFETGPGEQAQVDWGSMRMWIGESVMQIHVFTMVLGYSRRLFARAYPNEGVGALLDAHERAFDHFGGRTETILYDNPRTIVLSKNDETNEIRWNRTFEDRMTFYGVEPKLCRYYRAQTKGKVESGVKYVKRNALAGRRFSSLEDLNEALLKWCVEVADQRVHGTTHERPAERFLRESLTPIDRRPPAPREQVTTRIVPKDAYVAVETNRYPVPFEWVNRTVSVSVLATEIVIGHEASDSVRHPRLAGKHHVAKWNGAPRSLPQPTRNPIDRPPQFDVDWLSRMGEVEIRSLESYAAIAEVRP